MSPRAGGEHTLACFHPATVTTYCINLTIVAQHTEWLCQAPCRECVGTETRVNQRQTTGEIIIGKVGIILTQLHGGKHTLIYDSLAGERDNVEIFVVHSVLNLLRMM